MKKKNEKKKERKKERPRKERKLEKKSCARQILTVFRALKDRPTREAADIVVIWKYEWWQWWQSTTPLFFELTQENV